jgi:hypothetical protein
LRVGLYSIDDVFALSPGRTQLDVPQAAIKLVTEVP